MVNLLRQERRVAFRIVQLDPYLPDVYLRDSIDDTGLSASGAAAGRSPDIIVVQAPEADPNTKFADLLDSHEGDRIRPGNPQTIYVRVFNRRAVPVNATVDLFWTRPNAATVSPDPHAPAFIGTTWTRVKPTGTANVVVPATSSALAAISWQADDIPAADNAPNAYNAVGLIALVSSAEGTPDAAPPATEVFDTASFWRYFQTMSASNNAAFRVVLYGQ